MKEFGRLFEDGYGHRPDVDSAFKSVLKRDLFVQGLLLKWQEKVLPTTTTFADALHLVQAAEEQERQLGAGNTRNRGRASTQRRRVDKPLPGSCRSKVHRVVQGTKTSGAMAWGIMPGSAPCARLPLKLEGVERLQQQETTQW